MKRQNLNVALLIDVEAWATEYSIPVHNVREDVHKMLSAVIGAWLEEHELGSLAAPAQARGSA